jgi:hypothetical protein
LIISKGQQQTTNDKMGNTLKKTAAAASEEAATAVPSESVCRREYPCASGAEKCPAPTADQCKTAGLCPSQKCPAPTADQCKTAGLCPACPVTTGEVHLFAVPNMDTTCGKNKGAIPVAYLNPQQAGSSATSAPFVKKDNWFGATICAGSETPNSGSYILVQQSESCPAGWKWKSSDMVIQNPIAWANSSNKSPSWKVCEHE